jgi:hypothetical protein
MGTFLQKVQRALGSPSWAGLPAVGPRLASPRGPSGPGSRAPAAASGPRCTELVKSAQMLVFPF